MPTTLKNTTQDIHTSIDQSVNQSMKTLLPQNQMTKTKTMQYTDQYI